MEATDKGEGEENGGKEAAAGEAEALRLWPTVLGSLHGWERDPRFVRSVRRKIAVARQQMREGKALDGEAVMEEIIAESDDREGGRAPRSRGRKRRKRRGS